MKMMGRIGRFARMSVATVLLTLISASTAVAQDGLFDATGIQQNREAGSIVFRETGSGDCGGSVLDSVVLTAVPPAQ